MNITEIISAYEDFDRIHLEFSEQLDRFKANMEGESDDIMKTVEYLGSAWKKNGYDDFKKNMNGNISNILASLEKCDQLSQTLKKASAQLREELAILRDGV